MTPASRVTVFAPGRHEELGRGGRYHLRRRRAGHRPDAVSGRRSCARRRRGRRDRASIFPPVPTADAAAQLRAQGFATVAALDAGGG